MCLCKPEIPGLWGGSFASPGTAAQLKHSAYIYNDSHGFLQWQFGGSGGHWKDEAPGSNNSFSSSSSSSPFLGMGGFILYGQKYNNEMSTLVKMRLLIHFEMSLHLFCGSYSAIEVTCMGFWMTKISLSFYIVFDSNMSYREYLCFN